MRDMTERLKALMRTRWEDRQHAARRTLETDEAADGLPRADHPCDTAQRDMPLGFKKVVAPIPESGV